jgi:hypothetical protein
MAESKLRQIALLLIEKTKHRNVLWQQTSPGLITATLSGNSVSLQKLTPNLGLLTVYNSDGIPVARWQQNEPDYVTIATQLATTYDLAERQILKVEESLDNVLKKLTD